MNTNIIARAFDAVNTKAASAIANIDKVIGYQAERLAEEEANRWHSAQRSIVEILDMKQLPLTEFKWECEGGDAGATARVVLSALNTAMYAAFAAYRRENVLIKDDKRAAFDTPAFVGSKFDQSWDAAYMNGLAGDTSDHDEVEDDEQHRTFAECLRSVAVVLGYAVHIARFEGNGWMLSFDVKTPDGQKMTIRPLKDMVTWGQHYFEDTGDERYAIFKSAPSTFALDIPEIEVCKTEFKAWIHEYTPLSENQAKRARHVYDTRHERILARVGERKFGEWLYDLRQGKVYSAEKHGALAQIVTCTPFFAEQVNTFKASDVWQLYSKTKAVEELEKKAAAAVKAEEDAIFKLRVEDALAKIEAIHARLSGVTATQPKAEEPKADEPKVDEPAQTQTPGIHGQKSYFASFNGGRH